MDKRNRSSKRDNISWDAPILETPIIEPSKIIEEPIKVEEPKKEIKGEEPIIKEEIKVEEPAKKEEFQKYKVKVTYPCLRVRNMPSISGNEVGLITDCGIYNILDEENSFGKIGEEQWIMLKFTEKEG